MRYEEVNSNQELNQKVADYVAMEYKVENRTPTYVRLVKNDFSWGIFIILLFLLVIGALIYWAVKSGNKDEIIIRVKDNAPNNDNPNAIKYCTKCGTSITSEETKLCPECGENIN